MQLLKKFDRDIGWIKTKAMRPCVCGHLQKAHRPISGKCSRCSCPKFNPQKPKHANR